jgi:hypothetical protein
VEPIEANYVPDGDDWTVTVIGRGKTLTAKAPGLIAARDRADQLVEKVAPDEEHRTVVHLLNGDAVEFTTMYLNARLANRERPAPLEMPPSPAAAKADKPAKKPAKKSPSPRPKRAATTEQPGSREPDPADVS